MLHIFYTHSHITSIVIYDTIRKLLEQGERVVVITRRSQQWKSEKNVSVVDLSNYTITSLLSISYLKTIKEIKKILTEAINHTPYYLYIPDSYEIVCSILQKSSYCERYYYIEEGSISYAKSFSRHLRITRRIKNVVKNLCGFSTSDFILSQKFGGTISISEKAFPWNKKERIINSPKSYLENCISGQELFENYIIFGYLNVGISQLHYLVDAICRFIKENHLVSIAAKFHPYSYKVNPSAIKDLTEYMQKKDIDFTILQNDYVVEKALLLKKSNILSVQDATSLMIYALQNGGSAFLFKNGEEMECYNDYNTYLSESPYLVVD